MWLKLLSSSGSSSDNDDDKKKNKNNTVICNNYVVLDIWNNDILSYLLSTYCKFVLRDACKVWY